LFISQYFVGQNAAFALFLVAMIIDFIRKYSLTSPNSVLLYFKKKEKDGEEQQQSKDGEEQQQATDTGFK
jgi:hypothetical protein